MFILSSISRGLEFWLVNHTWIYENFELKGFKNIKFFGEISNNWPNDLLRTNLYKILESCWQSLSILQCVNTTSVIYKWGTFSPFSSLSYLQCFQVASLFQALKVQDNTLSLF